MIVRFFLSLSLAAAIALGQPVGLPKVGAIDFFGLKKVPRDRVEKALALKPGDPLPKSKGEVEEQIELLSNVVRAQLEAVCCENGDAILYIGVLERGGPIFEAHAAPSDEEVRLPSVLVETWQQFMEQLQIAVRDGKAEEDLTNGHSLMQYAPARDIQLKFPELVDKNLPVIRNVLRHSADENERAIAAFAIAYASKKAEIVDDLQYAVRDPDDGVRNNATRSFAGLAVLAKLKPASGIVISPTWFVEQLNSLTWSDRNKAAFALVSITESRDAQTLAMLKDRALDSMVDMARWNHLPHALPGFILLARSAGWEEKRIQDTWAAGAHRAAIDEILKVFDIEARKKK